MKDEVEVYVDVFECTKGACAPYGGNDVQIELRMLDPYVRKTLTNTGNGTFSARIKVPDVYGVFKFQVDYKRPVGIFELDVVWGGRGAEKRPGGVPRSRSYRSTEGALAPLPLLTLSLAPRATRFARSPVRQGLSWVERETVVPIRPFRHDEYARFLSQAFPYYASVLSMGLGFLAVGKAFVLGGGGDS